MKLELNNRIVATLRIMPALDAFKKAYHGDLIVRTPYPELFYGKQYKATNKPIDVEAAMPDFTEDTLLDVNPVEKAYDFLREYVGDRSVFYPAPDPAPSVKVSWDPAKLMCHEGRYVVNPPVCLCQRPKDDRWMSVGTVARILTPLALNMPLVNVLFEDDSPLINLALEVGNKQEVVTVNQAVSHYYGKLPMLTVIKALSMAGVVVTNTLWVFELSAALGRKIILLQPAFRRWRSVYQDQHLPPYKVSSGYTCPRKSCDDCVDRRCVLAVNDEEVRRDILEILNCSS